MPEDPLSIFRIVFASTCALFTLVHMPWFLRMIRLDETGLADANVPQDRIKKNEEMDESEYLRQWNIDLIPKLSTRAFVASGVIFAGLMICAALDFYPRIAFLAAIVFYFLFFNKVLWTSRVVRKTSLIPWTCLLLAIIPEEISMQMLTILAIKLLLVQMWFSAGLWKIFESKHRWFSGNCLRYNFVREAIQNSPDPERTLAVRISFLPAVVVAMATFILLAELLSPLVFFADTVLLGAICYAVFFSLHFGIYLIWRLDYLSFCFLPIGAILLVPSQFPFAEIFPAALQDWRALLTMAVMLLMIVNLALRKDIWPLHTWPMFASSPEFDGLKIHRLIAYHDNQRSVVQTNDRYLNRNIGRHGPYLRWYGEHWAKTNGIEPASIERLDLEMVSISDHKTLEYKTITSFIRLTQLARWRWLPPWEEVYDREE